MEKSKIDIAIDFLLEGQSYKIDDLRLGMIDSHTMHVTGWTQYIDINNVTKHIALSELNEIKELFNQMVDSSEILKKFITDKSIEYNLAYDYGMGAIGICSERDNVIKWYHTGAGL